MGTVFRELDESHVNVEDLFNILRMEQKVKEKENASEYEFKGGELELKDISYSYVREEGDTQQVETLLDGLNLKMEAGTTNAIVGPSGFGKTTLFNMIYRLFDPDNGSIKLDGQDLKDMTFASFRDQISIVP